MTEPFFSVITVCYNDGDILERCLNAVQDQTIRDFEFVFVINGSTDNTREIIGQFREEHPEIRITIGEIETNRGLSNGRNKGLSLATGKYITFNDSDDWMDRDCLQAVHDALTKEETDQVIQEVRIITEDGTEADHVYYSPEPSRWTKNSLQGNFYKRSVFTENGITFNEKTYFDDLYVAMCFNAASDSFQVIRSAHYNMLLRSRSFTHIDQKKNQFMAQRLGETFACMTWIGDTLKSETEKDEYVYSCALHYYSVIFLGAFPSRKERTAYYDRCKDVMDQYYPGYYRNKRISLRKENGFCGHFKRNVWLCARLERIDARLHNRAMMHLLLGGYQFSTRKGLYKQR